MKRLLFLSIIIISITCHAQEIKFLKATEQHWVGGVCCRYGTNYIFYLESTDTVNFIRIDSVWIGDRLFSEDRRYKLTNYYNVKKGVTTYRITASFSWDQKDSTDMKYIMEHLDVKPPRYKGVACLMYYSGKQLQVIPVKEFAKLNSIAYP